MRTKEEKATREKARKKKAGSVADVADALEAAAEAAVQARAEVVVNAITVELVRESAGSLNLRKS